MGAENSKTSFIQKIKLNEYYDFLYRRFDDNYGEVEIYKSKINPIDKIGIIKKYLKDHQNFQDHLQQIQTNYSLKHPNLLQIFHFSYSKEQQMCIQYNKINIVVEYHEENLESNILARKQQMKQFKILQLQLQDSYTEQEIWYIIDSLSDALQFLKQHKREYKDLHPKNVLFPSNGGLKLIESIIQDLPVTNYHKVILGYRNIEYLAPEQLEFIRKQSQKTSTEILQEKVNVFCLGILCAQQFYNQQELSINFGNLENSLHSAYCKQKFSLNLQKLISDMLNYLPSERPYYLEITKRINSYFPQQITSQMLANQSFKSSYRDVYDNNLKNVAEENEFQVIEIPMYETHKNTIQKFESDEYDEKLNSNNEKSIFNEPKQTINERIQEIRNNINNHYYTSMNKKIVTPISSRFNDTQIKFALSKPDYTILDDQIKMALIKSQTAQSRCYRPIKRFSNSVHFTPESNYILSTKEYQTPDDEFNLSQNYVYKKTSRMVHNNTKEFEHQKVKNDQLQI